MRTTSFETFIIGSSRASEYNMRRRTKLFKIQLTIYVALHRPVRWAKYYHFILYLLIVLPCCVINILEEAFLTESYIMYSLKILDMILAPILTIELVLRFWSTSCIIKFKGWKGKYRYLIENLWYRTLDILGIGTFFCNIFFKSDPNCTQELTCIKSFNIIIRILHFIQILQCNRFQIRALKRTSSALKEQINQMLVALSIATLSLFFASFLIYLFEKDQRNDKINDIFDGFYWGFITLSTVGYGDIVPKTNLGRIFTCACVIIGVSIFALPSAILGTGLALSVQEQKRVGLVRNPAAKLIQAIWRCYAAHHESKSIATWKQFQKTDGTQLTQLDKQCIRYLRLVRYFIARKTLKMVTRTFNASDMFEVYTSTHAHLAKKVHHIETKVNNLAITIGTKYEMKKEIKSIYETIALIKNYLHVEEVKAKKSGSKTPISKELENEAKGSIGKADLGETDLLQVNFEQANLGKTEINLKHDESSKSYEIARYSDDNLPKFK